MDFPPDSVLLSSRLGIIILDMQEEFLSRWKRTDTYRTVVANCRLLMDFHLRHPNHTHLWVVSYANKGALVPEINTHPAVSLATHICKSSHACLGRRAMTSGPSLNTQVRDLQCTTLLFGGINSTSCVASSIAGALDESLTVLLPSDSHGNFYRKTSCAYIPSPHDIRNHVDWARCCAGLSFDKYFHTFATTAELLGHITSVWQRAGWLGGHSPRSSSAIATAPQAATNAPLELV